MASSLETQHHKGSDVVYDVCCSICEDDGIHKEGLFNCQKCSKYFCDSCVLTHNKFLKDHSVTAKGGGDNWPATKSVDDALELCEEHTTEKLTMFCEDDETLLCHVCHLRNHKKCSHVVLLTDKVKSFTRPMDEAQIKTKIDSLMKCLEDMVKIGEHNITFLQTSYEKALEEIVDARRLINDNLDRLQQNTERKLEELHLTLKNSLENSRKNCVKFNSKIKGYNINDIHTKSPERSFIMYRKCLDQTTLGDSFLRNATTNSCIEFHLNKELEQLLASCKEFGSIASREAASCQVVDPNKIVSIQHRSKYNVLASTDKGICNTNAAIEFHLNKDLEQLLASCKEFGSIDSREAVSCQVVDPNKIVSIQHKSQYNVRTPTDKSNCNITGICESAKGDFIIADYGNECVKLLDQAYNLIEQIQLPSSPWFMCKMSSNEMALTVSDCSSVNEIHFVRVDNRRIVKFNRLQLNHSCHGIAIHQSDLFVTSGTAVYQYTMDGRLVKKLYEDKSGVNTVVGVGMSPDGKRVYVADIFYGRLLTLTRDGVVTEKLQLDPAFKTSYVLRNVHVAATGQVFVVGNQSVSQVDTDGKKVLNTIQLDISKPRSVFFNEDTSKMIVGFMGNDIIEFNTKYS